MNSVERGAGPFLPADAAPLSLPSPRVLRAYLRERFPVGSIATLVLLFFGAGRVITTSGDLHAGLADAGGAICLLLTFFHLRLFDEFKDAERDCRAHPDRLLSRGVVTFAMLRGLLAATISTEVVLAVAIGGPQLGWYLVVLGYSCAMFAEFFVPESLRRHPLLYAASHMAITPLMAMFIASFGGDGGVPWSLLLLATSGTVAYEVGRKTWAPEQEHPDADSYSRLIGARPAAGVTMALIVLCGIVTAALEWREAHPVLLIITMLAGTVGCGALCIPFMVRPDIRRARLVAFASSLELVVAFATLVIGGVVSRM